MKKKIILQILCLLTTFGLSSQAYSLTSLYYVGVGGSPTWPCGVHPTSPCSSINTVLYNAVADPLIKVARGAYTDNFGIYGYKFPDVSINGGWNEDFSAQQCDPANTLVSANNHTLMPIIIAEDENLTVTLACLSFRGTDSTHRMGIELSTQGEAALNLEQVTFSSFAGAALHMSAESGGQINADIKKTTFQNNYQSATAPPWSGAGLYASSYTGGDIVIHAENSLFRNNETRYAGTIHLIAHNSGSTTDLTLRNSTVSNNHELGSSDTAGLTATAGDNGATSVNIINSIVYGNTNTSGDNDIEILAFDGGSSNVTARYSILGTINTWTDGTYTDNGDNLNTDPLLDPSLHLKDDSPAIDAAQCGFNALTYLRVAPYDDIDGEKRPGYGKLSGCDIGADEHPGSLCLPIKSKSGNYAVICL